MGRNRILGLAVIWADTEAAMTTEGKKATLDAAFGYASRRKHLAQRIPHLRCSRCQTEQVQLVDWIAWTQWRCRLCKYAWEELQWGKP